MGDHRNTLTGATSLPYPTEPMTIPPTPAQSISRVELGTQTALEPNELSAALRPLEVTQTYPPAGNRHSAPPATTERDSLAYPYQLTGYDTQYIDTAADTVSTSSPPPPTTKKQKLKELAWKGAVWAIEPVHTVIVWLCVTIVVSGAIVALITVRILTFDDEDVEEDWNEANSQILATIFGLAALSNHPQRIVWLYLHFKPPGKRPYYDRTFPFAESKRWLTNLILFLLHANCITQYIVLVAMWGWHDPKERPQWMVFVFLSLSMVSGCGGTALLGWAQKKFSKQPPNTSGTVTQAMLFDELQKKLVAQASELCDVCDCSVQLTITGKHGRVVEYRRVEPTKSQSALAMSQMYVEARLQQYNTLTRDREQYRRTISEGEISTGDSLYQLRRDSPASPVLMPPRLATRVLPPGGEPAQFSSLDEPTVVASTASTNNQT
eukprot:TRINITY_DN66982_c6_g2_i1.p1 TRINITY_DN66982_c6_g2~~TRINITY_DN66982_c6_g2_i1.p1  ORF type:complete len:437 (+),score=33.08 TRINITY_DN66982_c6_g2_i1:82-1392(+)